MESQANWGNSMWNVTSDHFKNSLSNYHLVKNDNKYWLFHKSDESFNAWIDKKSNKFFMNSWPSHPMSFEETMKMYFDMFSVMSASESMMYEFSEKEGYYSQNYDFSMNTEYNSDKDYGKDFFNNMPNDVKNLFYSYSKNYNFK